MKLYGHIVSPFSRTVEVAAVANNIEYEFHHIDFAKGEHMSEWFLKLNPKVNPKHANKY